MTDATSTDALSTDALAGFSGAQPRTAKAKPGYLFGPGFDFLTLGGGSVMACGLIALLLPRGIPNAQMAALITVLMIAINQPHFAHSYQMFYRHYAEKAFGAYPVALRIRYIVAGLVVPAALIAFLVAAATGGSARAVSYGANLMFFLVGWHYVKQGYGILIVDSVQKRQMFGDRAKIIFRVNGYACWALAWLGLNHALSRGTPYLGITYYSLPIPTVVYQAAMAVTVATTLAAAFVLAQHWREKRTLPWNGVVAYLTTLYLWVIFVRINPLVLAVVPTFHSLQYLAVVWRYQLNAGTASVAGAMQKTDAFAHFAGRWRGFALFVGVGVLLGFLGFMGVPRALDAVLPQFSAAFGGNLFLFAFYIVINVHHYFLDNVMWRRGNPDVQQYILKPAR